ncbi:MAG: hypothetical protein AMXMBFR7_51750 [Planctomycetota bacterium]
MDVLDILRLGMLLALAGTSLYSDLKSRRIYNAFTYPAILMGWGFALTQSLLKRSWLPESFWYSYLLESAGGMAFCLLIMVLVYWQGGVGGGDVKLMAAMGALAAWPLALYLLVYATLAGLAMGLSMVIWQGREDTLFRRAFKAEGLIKGRPLEESVQVVPFGAAFGVGVVWTAFMAFLG